MARRQGLTALLRKNDQSPYTTTTSVRPEILVIEMDGPGEYYSSATMRAGNEVGR